MWAKQYVEYVYEHGSRPSWDDSERIGGLSHIVFSLRIGHTKVSGTISQESFNNPMLIQYDAPDTERLSGTIPENITSPLIIFGLDGNQLSGTMPVCVLGPRDLDTLWIIIIASFLTAMMNYHLPPYLEQSNIASVVSLNSNEISGAS